MRSNRRTCDAGAVAVDGEQRARRASARAAVAEIESGMTVGLGSGRAVNCVIDEIAARWPHDPPLRAVCASVETDGRARGVGIARVELDGRRRLDVAIDGADEVDPRLNLIKGGGGALLREKLVVEAAERFVVVAEAAKRVERLGERRSLPVEVVRFAWLETRRRLLELVPEAILRTGPGGEPVVTDEGHYLLDCPLPRRGEIDELARAVKAVVGVVDHGLFLGMADLALLGTPDGGVETVGRG
jgi:ribose 5-phosphate isomerase A